MKVRLILFLAFLSALTACFTERDIDKISLHPSPDYMPHPDVEPLMLEIAETRDSLKRFSDNIQLLYKVLHYDSVFNQKKELNVLTSGNVEISSLNDSTLLILEKMQGQFNTNERLIQYDVNKHQYKLVAGKGRGPGDLFFSEELAIHQNKAYVAMQGFQISVFNCELVTCEHEKVIETEYNSYSLAPSEENLLFIGMATYGLEQSSDPSSTKQNLIFKMDYDGEILDSFFPVYNFRSPIIRGSLNEGGTVRRFLPTNSTIVTMEYFPYIYEYDGSGKLKMKYEIPRFQKSFYEYNENKRGAKFLNSGDNSSVILTQKLSDWELMIIIKERRNAEWISREEGFKGEEWNSYYIFNVEEKQLYRVGDDVVTQPYDGEERVIHVVEQGVIINDMGTLSFIKS